MKRGRFGRLGRPKSEEKREAILEAAGELFLSLGLQGTSMDAVAERAGVSKQTVYSHFKNKEDLYRAVIVAKVESYGFAETALPEDSDLDEALCVMGRRFIDLMFDDEVIAMHRVVIGESVAHPKIAELFYETGPGTTKRAIQRFLSAQAQKRRLVIADLDYAAALFLSMVCGPYQMPLLLNRQPALASDFIDTHVRKAVAQFITLHRPS